MAVVDTDRVVASVASDELVAIALFWPILTPTRRVGVNSIFVAVIDTNELVAIDTAFFSMSFPVGPHFFSTLNPPLITFTIELCYTIAHHMILTFMHALHVPIIIMADKLREASANYLMKLDV